MDNRITEKFNDKKCLITGGAGFIGSNLAIFLSDIGAKVTVIDNFSTGRKENTEIFSSLGISMINADLCHLDRTKKHFEEIDYVFHQAAVPSVPRSIAEPIFTNSSNINATLNVLENSRKGGVTKVVYAASSSAYGNTETLPKVEDMFPSPLSPYAVQKLAGEMYCKTYHDNFGLRTTSLRYFNVYGPNQDPNSEYSAVIPIFIRQAFSNEPLIIFGDGETSRDFTFIADVIQANLCAALSESADGHTVNVAYGNRCTLTELAQHIIDITDSKSEIIYVDERKGDVKHSLADLSKTKDLMGYKPEYNLKRGLEKTIQFYKDNVQ